MPSYNLSALNPEHSHGGDGSLIWSGQPDYAEAHPELRNYWYKIRMYREMLDNSPLIARGFSDMAFMLLAGTITVEAAPTEDGPEVAEMVKYVLSGMETKLSDVFFDQITSVAWGWNVSNIVWKQTPEGLAIARIEQRPQYTLYGWDVRTNETGKKIYSMIQQQLDGTMATIPAALSLHVTMGQGTGGPEGRAALRHVYVPYRDASRLNQTMLIGFHQSMVGVTVLKPPAEAVSAPAGTEEARAVAAAQTALATAVRGERTTITLPGVDQDGKDTWKLDRIRSDSGAETANTIALADRYDQKTLIGLWAGYLALGQAGTSGGTAAQTSGQIGVTAAVFAGIANSIMDAINAQVISVLCELRGYDKADHVTLKWTPSKTTNLPDFWTAMEKAQKTGFLAPNPDGSDEDHTRTMFGLPPRIPPENASENMAAE